MLLVLVVVTVEEEVAETSSTVTLLLEASVVAVSLDEALVEDTVARFVTMVLGVVLWCGR